MSEQPKKQVLECTDGISIKLHNLICLAGSAIALDISNSGRSCCCCCCLVCGGMLMSCSLMLGLVQTLALVLLLHTKLSAKSPCCCSSIT